MCCLFVVGVSVCFDITLLLGSSLNWTWQLPDKKDVDMTNFVPLYYHGLVFTLTGLSMFISVYTGHIKRKVTKLPTWFGGSYIFRHVLFMYFGGSDMIIVNVDNPRQFKVYSGINNITMYVYVCALRAKCKDLVYSNVVKSVDMYTANPPPTTQLANLTALAVLSLSWKPHPNPHMAPSLNC